MKKDLLELRDIRKSNEVSQTLEYSSEISRISERSPKVKVTLPTFKSAPIDGEQLLFYLDISPKCLSWSFSVPFHKSVFH